MAHRSIRLFVRTKKKYEPGQFNSQLWYIDVTDFAGCAVGDIKKVSLASKLQLGSYKLHYYWTHTHTHKVTDT